MSDQENSAIVMPPEIAAAVLEVMSKIEKIDKGAGAPGGVRYKFTSVDQFFEELGPKMSAAGLFTMVHEGATSVTERVTIDDRGSERRSNWLNVQYQIWLYHRTGVSYGPIKREIIVNASGPQSYASAQSFVVKYFLRLLFMIPTGDADADTHEQTQLPAREPRQERREPSQGDRAAWEVKARSYIARCGEEWAKAKTRAELAAWWAGSVEDRRAMFPELSDKLYVDFKGAFAKAGNALPEGDAAKTADPPKQQQPKDNLPEFKGDGRPSESALRTEFKGALVRAVSYDDCNEAFIKWIEPHEKSLSDAFLNEMHQLLKERAAKVAD